jgi:2-C-methyl-D-erythritol 2,4-cyclodiphosphate synthase
MLLLEKVGALLEENNYVIENIDSTIIAQKPKMAPHIQTMRGNIAKALLIDVSQVNVKATTEEGLGFTGTEQGIAATAVALLTSVENMIGYEQGCGGCSGCSMK